MKPPTVTRARAAALRRLYGLAPEQYLKMYRQQGGLCAICFQVRRLNVDHDHGTGRVRGLLCYTCNHRLLGRGLESAQLHDQAGRYLRSTFDGRAL